MNLRSLLQRKQGNETVPLLPPPETDEIRSMNSGKRSRPPNEERLERLLTPSELDLVQQHQI
ncbi:hypothetical protein HLB23_37930 [Nocardia uniformis]|uniref:Uncharacterized protein n=1 Tax=Nocardia uniformis TaxID=53432 RepID=A0A849CG42_9NOCA|nr:hypothetical protein [Nocardia uniformis]NNH75567.1 hypothetical protein [Nocardia uniformis]